MAGDPEFKDGGELRSWRIGARVSHTRSGDGGTILEMSDKVKGKWDSGKTSYYRPGTLASIRLEPADK